MESMIVSLTTQLKEKGYDLYYPTKKEGSMCYNPSVIPQSSLLHVYTLLRRQTSKDSNHVEQICTMIRQVINQFWNVVTAV
jgi:hypothetical protein